MRECLVDAVADAGGALPFDRYMDLALYAPGLGYYVNGSRKLGEAGDFVTAPEVSPLFGRCLAGQVAECLQRLDGAVVIEFGAGTGRMAADVLLELQRLDQLPTRYLIMEVSPSLRAVQYETLERTVPRLLRHVEWLDRLPDAPLSAVVVGNELLDAMPVHRFRRDNEAWQELHVGLHEDRLVDRWLPVSSHDLDARLTKLWPEPALPAHGYSSELNLRLGPWMDALAACISTGCLLLVDYGYTRHEYYHPERAMGTLICHFRHRAHTDPYLLPGLQDVTANVDFTAVAEAGVAAGFSLAGYTTQAHFLIDSGLESLLATSDPTALRDHLQVMQGVKKLTLPSEMGERFKVIAFIKDCTGDLCGFRSRDMRDRL
jgi:SAM-dependent MidA family methyltransferase